MSLPNVIEKHVGQYRILRTLGSGGMGTVHLGEHRLLGRRAAIKTLLPSLSTHREIVDRFFNEARAISAISDPGVVQIFDFGYHVDGTAYIVMEYLEGESLAARLTRLGKLRVVDALRLARQLSSSLAAAHERDIVHRDLKPGNVFVIRDPEVQGGERAKILDFGICKLGDPQCATTTQTGSMLGTPVYMSPEQCRGAGRVDHRSDVYSLGCVLFHMLCGRPPFDCEGIGDYIASHLKEAPPAPSTIAPELSPAVDALIARCLAKDPQERFESMAEVQQAIEQVLAHTSDTGSPVSAGAETSTPLGEGFQSSYDVNRASQQRHVDDAPISLGWFVDSVMTGSVSQHYETPRSGWGRRFAYVLALLVGIASGVGGASYALEAEAASEPEPPTSPTLAVVEVIEPRTAASALEIAPPEPVVVETVAIEPPVQPVPLKKSRSARSSRPHVTKAARPRPVIQKPVTKPEPEDLYDTR